MQMSDAIEVVQVAGAINANAKLAEGWKLIAVLPGTVQSTGAGVVMYVLGKPEDKRQETVRQTPITRGR